MCRRHVRAEACSAWAASRLESRSPEQTTREEPYAEIDRGTRLDSTSLQLFVFPTVVAAIKVGYRNILLVPASGATGALSRTTAFPARW